MGGFSSSSLGITKFVLLYRAPTIWRRGISGRRCLSMSSQNDYSSTSLPLLMAALWSWRGGLSYSRHYWGSSSWSHLPLLQPAPNGSCRTAYRPIPHNRSQQSWVESQGSPWKSHVGRFSGRNASRYYPVHECSATLSNSTTSRYGSVDQYRVGSLQEC
jgi:hypothetical protein